MGGSFEAGLMVHYYFYMELIFKWEDFLNSNMRDFKKYTELGYKSIRA
jgi:hypothetical protein